MLWFKSESCVLENSFLLGEDEPFGSIQAFT